MRHLDPKKKKSTRSQINRVFLIKHNIIIREKEREAYGEGEVEDELERELAELLEEDVAEDYETRPDE